MCYDLLICLRKKKLNRRRHETADLILKHPKSIFFKLCALITASNRISSQSFRARAKMTTHGECVESISAYLEGSWRVSRRILLIS